MHNDYATCDISHTFKDALDMAEFNPTMDNDFSLVASIHLL